MSKLYQIDIKQVEFKKWDFEEESKDFYVYVSCYFGQRYDFVKVKQSDIKYQIKWKNFELKCFDYFLFMQDLFGGCKEQEIFLYFIKYVDVQVRCFFNILKKIEDLLLQFEVLFIEVLEVDKEYQYQCWECEEKRRLFEKSNFNYNELDI